MDVYREYKKIIEKKKSLEREIETLPRGYLRFKKIGKHNYCYLQFRDGDRVKSVYVKNDGVEHLRKSIEKRKQLLAEWKTLSEQQRKLEDIMHVHTIYRPVRAVDYEDYVIFMSALAHDLKRLGVKAFLLKYDASKYRGLKKRYLKGLIDYILGIERNNTRKGNDLVLDPFTYQMYFKYGDKSVLEEELQKAVPAFLNQGLLVTNIQEAVNGASGGTGLS